jgi:hypothetical protein
MKNKILLITVALSLSLQLSQAIAEDNITIIAPTSQVADGLDLQAVSEVFTETNNLEDFEKALNDPDEGINNLDLDGNGEVDYIRIVEEMSGAAHLIILQAAIGKDEFQDVATIEVEKVDDNYTMQVHGNVLIYGENYYYHPTHVRIHTWPIITWIYRPVYRPYHSRFYFGFYPRWWRPFHPVHHKVYRTRIVRYTGRNTFVVKRVSHVRTINRIKYKPRTSVRVSKRVSVRRNGRTTTVRNTKKVTHHNNGSTTVKRTKKVTTKKNGHKKTVKKTIRKKKR